MNGERATTVNGKGREIADADMLAVARGAGIPKKKALEAIELTRAVLVGMKLDAS